MSCLGAGFECLPMDVLRARGIATANGSGTNDDCVADHAFGLLIGIVRGMRMLDRQCREGVWREVIPQPPNVSGKKLGIFGLGTIGQKIAKRAAGFDLEIGYHNRSARPELPHRYFGSLRELAQWCDFLVCAAPGGPATRHAIDAQVLVKGGHLEGADAPDALVGRGPIVEFPGARIDTANTHGTGCSLSSALATRLARGESPAAPVAAPR